MFWFNVLVNGVKISVEQIEKNDTLTGMSNKPTHSEHRTDIIVRPFGTLSTQIEFPDIRVAVDSVRVADMVRLYLLLERDHSLNDNAKADVIAGAADAWLTDVDPTPGFDKADYKVFNWLTFQPCA